MELPFLSEHELPESARISFGPSGQEPPAGTQPDLASIVMRAQTLPCTDAVAQESRRGRNLHCPFRSLSVDLPALSWPGLGFGSALRLLPGCQAPASGLVSPVMPSRIPGRTHAGVGVSGHRILQCCTTHLPAPAWISQQHPETLEAGQTPPLTCNTVCRPQPALEPDARSRAVQRCGRRCRSCSGPGGRRPGSCQHGDPPRLGGGCLCRSAPASWQVAGGQWMCLPCFPALRGVRAGGVPMAAMTH